ncbi:MAG: hypothetical protein JO210_18040 [Acidobacteriaceae bacterium]|nr:hypothetical protein [Acidobacteriaceae bacterium]
MAPSTTKRVVLYRWDREPVDGIINPAGYLLENLIEWITPDGRLQLCSFEECKALCFVTEVGKSDLFTEHNLFERRPRVPGLWTRFVFRDGALLDGILSHNLLEWPNSGYFIVPPKAKATRQKVFIPRAALTKTELRGVVGGFGVALAKQEEIQFRLSGRQLSMFDP